MEEYEFLYSRLDKYVVNNYSVTDSAIDKIKEILLCLEKEGFKAPFMSFKDYGAIELEYYDSVNEYKNINIKVHDFFCVLCYKRGSCLVTKRVHIKQVLDYIHKLKIMA